MSANKVAVFCVTILFAVVVGSAQKAESWMAISSADGEFSAVMPTDSLVINEDKQRTRLVASVGDARFDVGRRPAVGGQRYLPGAPRDLPDTDSKLFELGKAKGRITITDKPGNYFVSIHAVSSRYTYSLSASGKRRDDSLILRFLQAIQFGGQPLLTVAAQKSDDVGAAVDMKQLKTSDIVKEYLNKPVNSNLVVKYEPISDKLRVSKPDENVREEPDDIEKPFTTRPLIVLAMPRAQYTNSARMDRVSGAVKVAVLLRADGTVGAITADPTLDKSLAREAVEAAKNIKFLPVEVDGKAVDTKRVFVYSFAVY